MFEQLLLNKNKIATIWHDVYYVKFAPKLWHLNEALVLRLGFPSSEPSSIHGSGEKPWSSPHLSLTSQ
jgi:hypothetical protein